MVKLIDPRTGEPFKFTEVNPTKGIQNLRQEILDKLRPFHRGSKYDAAQTTYQNENHWKWADELSPNAANSLSVRKRLRSRSRYEVANNGYLKGIILTKSIDIVGSGPSLQVNDIRFTPEQKAVIETTYSRRAKRIKLRRKLRQLSFAKMQDGEAFSFRIVNRKLRDGVKVDQRVFECDQVSHYDYRLRPSGDNGPLEIDGIRYDRQSGEPEFYHLLNSHPGEDTILELHPLEGKWIKAENVIHWFRRDRPWNRGIPETIPTLPLWALLRRYTMAVVQNAEIAADFTVLLKSLQTPNTVPFNSSGTPLQPTASSADDWFDSFPIDRGLMTVLPDQYEALQLDPKQPVSAYDAFVNALVQEAARPLLVPRNMAIGNSGGYNMASGALDRQMYIAAVKDERHDCEEEVLDKDLDLWWFEAIRTADYFADEISGNGVTDTIRRFQQLREDPPDHMWRWDDIPEHHDPVKQAQAIDILHKGGHLSDVDIQEGRFNRRVEDHYANLETQQQERTNLGILGAEEAVDTGFPDDENVT